jgi:hypothetical protein
MLWSGVLCWGSQREQEKADAEGGFCLPALNSRGSSLGFSTLAIARIGSLTKKLCNACDFRISSRAMRKWIVATLLVATAAVAQQTHNQYEPPDAPGAGQKLLAQFAGDWDVVKTFFPMNGKPIVTNGTCKQYMIQDGKFLQSDFTFLNADGTKTTGTGISGFDSKTNRFTTVWYDSHQTTMSIRQSDGTFDGKNIVLWTTPLDAERKTVARAHLEEDGRVLLHRHFLINDKGEERLMIEFRMTRK